MVLVDTVPEAHDLAFVSEALRLDPTNSQVISSLKDVEKEIEKQAAQNGAA